MQSIRRRSSASAQELPSTGLVGRDAAAATAAHGRGSVVVGGGGGGGALAAPIEPIAQERRGPVRVGSQSGVMAPLGERPRKRANSSGRLNRTVSDGSLSETSDMMALDAMRLDAPPPVFSLKGGVDTELRPQSRLLLRNIGSDSKAELITLLRDNCALRELYVEDSQVFSSSNEGAVGLLFRARPSHTQPTNDMLVRSLGSVESLESLTLRNVEVYDKLLGQIFAALQQLPKLRRLSLVNTGCTKAISDDLRLLCQSSVSLLGVHIWEETLTEAAFTWTITSAVGECPTSVAYYMRQNSQLARMVKSGRTSIALNARRIESLPAQLFHNVESLVHLDLTSNALVALPEEMGKFVNLRTLDLTCNLLSVLPMQIYQLTLLEELLVAHNELVEVTEAIGFLHNLRVLDVSCNRLRDLPVCIGCLTKLHEVKFQDPMRPSNRFNFPQDMLDGGSYSILKHLRSRLRHKRPLERWPLFVIGARDSGKTRMLHSMAAAHGGFAEGSREREPPMSARSSARGVRKTSTEDGQSPKRRSRVLSDGASGGGGSRKGSFESATMNASSEVSEEPSLLEVVPFVLSGSSRLAQQQQSQQQVGMQLGGGGGTTGSSAVTSYEPIFDAWEFCGADLVPLFQRDTTVILYAVNVAAESFSYASMLRWMQAVTHHRDTRIILVGTFLDQLPSAKVPLVEAEIARLRGEFPSIREHLLVSFKSDVKGARKDLRLAISRAFADHPLRTMHVEETWHVLLQKLTIAGRMRSVPVASWSEISRWAVESGIAPGDNRVEMACALLASSSRITFSDTPGNDDVLAFLNAPWMSSLWDPIVLLQCQLEHRGIVPAEDLVLVWQSANCPAWVTRPWVHLLKRVNMMESVPKRRLVVIPSLLPAQRNMECDANLEWPTHCPAEFMQYSRVYTFDAPLPSAMFAALLVRLLRNGWDLCMAWQSGMLLRLDGELLLVEGSASGTVLKVHVRAKNASALLISLLSALATLMSDSLNRDPVVEVPCIHCLHEHSYDPHKFSRAELEDAVASGQGVVLCRGVNPVLIHSMAPDISMYGLAVHTFNYADLKMEELLGEGGFAKVYKGRQCGQVVAIKKLIPLNAAAGGRPSETDPPAVGAGAAVAMAGGTGASVALAGSSSPEPGSGSSGSVPQATSSKDRRDLFSEFRREAWLMSGLEHPNLVILKGLCMEPFCIVMEYMNAGTLHSLIHNDAIKGPFSPALVCRIALDIAKGMEFLHGITPPICHRDLKSPNVLLHLQRDPRASSATLTDAGGAASAGDGDTASFILTNKFGSDARSLAALPANPDDLIAKVADFGMSREAELTSSFRGTAVENPTWTAPEVMLRQAYTGKVDVYSFGVILWELVSREMFFGEMRFMSEIEAAVCRGKRPNMPEQCPADLQRLIRRCWDQDPAKRPSFVDVSTLLSSMAVLLGLATVGRGGVEAQGLKQRRRKVVHPSVDVAGAVLESGGAAADLTETFEAPRVLVPEHSSSVSVMAVAEPHLWTGSSHGELFVWDLISGTVLYQTVLGAGSRASRSLDAIGSSGGGNVAGSATADGQPSRPPAVSALHSLHHSVWVGARDGSLFVYSRSLKVIKQPKRHDDAVIFIGNEGSETVITIDAKGTLRRWNINTFKFTAVDLAVPVMSAVQMGVNMALGLVNGTIMLVFPDHSTYALPGAHTQGIHQLLVVLDQLWSCSSDKTIRVWRLGADARSIVLNKALTGHSSRVFCLASDPLCQMVFSGSWDTQILVWDVKALRFLGRLASSHKDAVSCVAYVATSAALAGTPNAVISGSMDRSVAIYRHKPDAGAAATAVAGAGGVRTGSPVQRDEDGAAAARATQQRNSALLNSNELHLELLTDAERMYLMEVTKSNKSQPRLRPLQKRRSSFLGRSSLIRQGSVDVIGGGSRTSQGSPAPTGASMRSSPSPSPSASSGSSRQPSPRARSHSIDRRSSGAQPGLRGRTGLAPRSSMSGASGDSTPSSLDDSSTPLQSADLRGSRSALGPRPSHTGTAAPAAPAPTSASASTNAVPAARTRIRRSATVDSYEASAPHAASVVPPLKMSPLPPASLLERGAAAGTVAIDGQKPKAPESSLRHSLRQLFRRSASPSPPGTAKINLLRRLSKGDVTVEALPPAPPVTEPRTLDSIMRDDESSGSGNSGSGSGSGSGIFGSAPSAAPTYVSSPSMMARPVRVGSPPTSVTSGVDSSSPSGRRRPPSSLSSPVAAAPRRRSSAERPRERGTPGSYDDDESSSEDRIVYKF